MHRTIVTHTHKAKKQSTNTRNIKIQKIKRTHTKLYSKRIEINMLHNM